MASEKRITANRKNAKKSTGPRTTEGKRIASRNALKTGLYAKLPVLPDEDGNQFRELIEDLEGEWRPVGRTEQETVRELAWTLWRQYRSPRIERGLYAMYREFRGQRGGPATAFVHDGMKTDAFWRLTRIDTVLERRVMTLIKRLEHLQDTRGNRPGLSQIALQPDDQSPGGESLAI